MSSPKVVITLGEACLQFEGPPEFVEKQLISLEQLSKGMRTMTERQHLLQPEGKALEHTWQWFSLHATQRMQAVNFFFVAVAFLSAGYVTALEIPNKHIAAGVAIFGLAISLCFSRLELRVRELIHAGEAAMKPLQAKLAGAAGLPEIQILQNVENGKTCFTKYSHVIGALHLSSIVVFILGALYAIFLVE